MDILCAPKSEGVGLSDRAISFRDFQPMWSWSTNVTDRRTDRQTDGQTDGQTTCDRKTALCTKVHRAVIIVDGFGQRFGSWTCLNIYPIESSCIGYIGRVKAGIVCRESWPSSETYRPIGHKIENWVTTVDGWAQTADEKQICFAVRKVVAR